MVKENIGVIEDFFRFADFYMLCDCFNGISLFTNLLVDKKVVLVTISSTEQCVGL